MALAPSLVLLALHAWTYRFLTDDAFISFRYARNLAQGHGLVFNPGFERVEGYTNFLWVLVLAAWSRVGIAPEVAASPLSLIATAGLWALVAWFARRLAGAGPAWWAALLAPFALALTRSVAVWSTGGLETRVFELLLVAAVLRGVVEVESAAAGRPRRPVAPWLFGLACLTRPDGLLPALAAAALGALWLSRRQRLDARRWAMAWLPFAALVGGHLVFRRLYYGDWLPNTYYAKVGGTLWWSAGGAYLAAFALEYALWLWLPLAGWGAAALARRGRGAVPLLFAGVVLPHAAYVAAVGGDYFEYRPLDLGFPFLFLLAGEGVRAIATAPGRSWVAAGAASAALIGLWELPFQSRRQFPPGNVVGFPGQLLDASREARAFLDPSRTPIYRWPALSAAATAHRDLLRRLTRQFVGLRQEEHARLGAAVAPEGRRLRGLVERGLLPGDLHVAMGAVGGLPYYSDLRVLDMQGLTDAQVARSGPSRGAGERLMAHDRALRWEDAVARGVDLVAVDAHLLLPLTSDALLSRVREAAAGGDSIWAADVGDGLFLVALLPQGAEAAARRMPGLRFERLSDPRFVQSFLTRSISAWSDSLAARPADPRARLRLAWLLLAVGDYPRARSHFQAAVAARPEALEGWDGLAWSEAGLGNPESERAALLRAIAVAETHGDHSHLDGLRQRLRELAGRAPLVVTPGSPP